MKEAKLYEILKQGYETTNQKINRFKDAIDRIKWDKNFEADGEIYFVKDGFTLTIENIDPFKEQWKPMAYFSDGSVIQF